MTRIILTPSIDSFFASILTHILIHFYYNSSSLYILLVILFLSKGV